MEREPNFIPHNLPEEVRDDVKGYFKEREDKALQERSEGEVEKTPEQLKFIDIITKCVIREIESLGIEVKAELTPEHIHFLTKEAFSNILTDRDPEDSLAFAHKRNYAIYVNTDEIKNRLQFFMVMLHEILHHFSYEKYHVDMVKRHLSDYRSGYVVYNSKSEKEPEHDHFYFLNEMVVHQLVQRVFTQNQELLRREFNITPEEERTTDVGYPVNSLNIFRKIIERIAKHQNKRVIDVWKNYEQGFFTGEMMHLRDIEDVYGRGSLRVLGSIHQIFGQEQFELLERYFVSSKTDTEREEIAKKLLDKKVKAI